MLFRSLITLLLPLLFSSVSLADSNYYLDQDVAPEYCRTVQFDEGKDDEEFRLWCINENHTFQKCALTCTNALFLPGSVGTCPSTNNNFYTAGLEFWDITKAKTRSNKVMYNLNSAKGKTTIFAVLPLWGSQAQYFYILLEELAHRYGSSVEVVIQTMLVEEAIDYELDQRTGKTKIVVPEIRPVKSSKVRVLDHTHPSMVMNNPFIDFLSQIHYKSGFPSFDVFIDRPVVFVIDNTGMTVERIVCPTLKNLEQVVLKYTSKGTIKAF